MKHKFAAQLYTLRKEISSDFPGVLWKLKDMGWEAVQIDGLFGYQAQEIAHVMKKAGLKAAGMHVPLVRLKNEFEKVVEEARLFETNDIICPYLDEEMRNAEGYIQAKKELIHISRKAAPLRLNIGYHNHDFEFMTSIDGETALDYLLTPEDGVRIFPEIDTYWVKKAGFDPLDYIEQFSYRMPILHLKDMSNNYRKDFVEIGEGCIDFLPILNWGEQNGVKWYAVEQDECSGKPLDSLELSLKNLINMTTNHLTN
ncbi:sugar phosphate isomerase/epimerase family protein [Rossellomorea sp. NS-SX7]|uniref:sugar phosphate isomerase/epimerase family protein n=1 Tax=Rossellomorea sp. NS-SX7 TaxID=3463856 RepID=UPI00405A1970